MIDFQHQDMPDFYFNEDMPDFQVVFDDVKSGISKLILKKKLF